MGEKCARTLLHSFVDSNQQRLRSASVWRISAASSCRSCWRIWRKKPASLFDSSKYKVEFTGTSVTYLEGSSFCHKRAEGQHSMVIFADSGLYAGPVPVGADTLLFAGTECHSADRYGGDHGLGRSAAEAVDGDRLQHCARDCDRHYHPIPGQL
jgi:hypothetical protein